MRHPGGDGDQGYAVADDPLAAGEDAAVLPLHRVGYRPSDPVGFGEGLHALFYHREPPIQTIAATPEELYRLVVGGEHRVNVVVFPVA